MPIRLSRFEMPTRIVRDDATATETYARYTVEPFEIGYGRTIGNSLRRVLLSSIEGFAIKAIKIDGAAHEFCSLPGISEDVTDIVLNLKRVLLKSFTRDTRWLSLNKRGPCVITAADFTVDNSIEVLNPDQVIATLDTDGVLKMEALVGVGRGFCLAEGNKDPSFDIGVIPIDSAFSPVTRVNYDVVNTRVGQRTDYERLILDVWTDGRVSPDEAIKTSAALLCQHLGVFITEDDSIEFETPSKSDSSEQEELRRKLNMSVNEIELSVRSANCLNSANIKTVGELVMKDEAAMLKYRNFGKKSLTEIKDKLQEMGLCLGYKFDPNLLDKIND
ncbi:MAG: DNA-directed RNA polymerase subunit alpha [Kiritimatiellae bacterium]|nr:DNA-directed RNA polymerase subunit alpha [Kiritimatiellia bacterium]